MQIVHGIQYLYSIAKRLNNKLQRAVSLTPTAAVARGLHHHQNGRYHTRPVFVENPNAVCAIAQKKRIMKQLVCWVQTT